MQIMSLEKVYLNLYSKANSHKQMVCFWNRILTYLFYISYPILLIWTFVFSYENLLKMILVPGISFAFVSLLRKIIARKRPYETFAFIPVISKESSCNSMPSRHIFSSTIISVLYFSINPLIGIIMLCFSGIEAWIRVIGGVHYISDVAVGMILGIIFGCLTFFI